MAKGVRRPYVKQVDVPASYRPNYTAGVYRTLEPLHVLGDIPQEKMDLLDRMIAARTTDEFLKLAPDAARCGMLYRAQALWVETQAKNSTLDRVLKSAVEMEEQAMLDRAGRGE